MREREVWRDIIGWPGYQVSSQAKVRSFRNKWGFRAKPKLLARSVGTTKRYKVLLYNDGKRATKDVHRLMLEAFVSPCPPGMQALHRDDNPLNNDLSNLYWGTPKQNGQDRKRNGHNADKRGSKHHMAKLTEADIPVIRTRIATGETHESIAKDFGVTREAVSGIHQGRLWTHV